MKLFPSNGCEIWSFDVTLVHFLENVRKNLVGRDYKDSSGQYKILGTEELALFEKCFST